MTTKPLARTLVVEDNPDARQGLAAILENRGFDVATVENGKEALLYLRDHAPPDVIILDMMMPVLDGWKFLDHLRDMNMKPKPWVVVATAAPAINREWAADHGCGGFLRKPIDEGQLMDELHRCLDRTVEDKIIDP